MPLREQLRAHIPTREQIHNNRWLAWLLPWLGHPKLWHWSRRGVATGVALGVFFGLLIPIAQIPLSVGAAIVLRANVPAAAVSTLVTNPITFGPIYYGAYRLGVVVTGEANASANPPTIDPQAGLWNRIAEVGKPLLVGLVITAVLMGLTIYGLISLVWRWRILSRRRKR
jgi:hypothetical protein